MHTRSVLVALAAAAGFASGCGPNCQSTCSRIFEESECGIRIPGEEPSEVIKDCIRACETALDTPGELEGYDPYEVNTSGSSAELDNEKQAALWMECVENTPCQDIDDGYCAPILF